MSNKILLLALACSSSFVFGSDQASRHGFWNRNYDHLLEEDELEVPFLMEETVYPSIKLASGILTIKNMEEVTAAKVKEVCGPIKELVEEIQIIGNVKEIQKDAFCNFTSLKKVVLPTTLQSIGVRAFRDCSALEDVRFWKSPSVKGRIEQIGAEAFRGCRSLKRFYIPISIGKIERGAFRDCLALERVVIGRHGQPTHPSWPNGELYLRTEAFWGCGNLKKVVVLGNVKLYVDVTTFSKSRPCSHPQFYVSEDSPFQRFKWYDRGY